ncbi:MAG: hypothetical protein Q4C96_01605 [Planctomycetia bacterium]|nr:hypothetical protein [Planctomycetia bacterium]
MSYFLIGTDEAGYGPFIGPLAVSATLWEVDRKIPSEKIYEALSPVVGVSAKEALIAVTDSKKIYKTSLYKSLSGIASMEKSVLGMLESLRGKRFCEEGGKKISAGEISREGNVNSCDLLTFPVCPADVFFQFSGEVCGRDVCGQPWGKMEFPFPLANSQAEILCTAEILREKMEQQKIYLREVCSDLILPQRFNRETEKMGSKGVFLMEVTLRLAARLYRQITQQRKSWDVHIFCDKIGGRNFYFSPLMEFFPGSNFQIIQESREVSEYRHDEERGTLRIRFQAKGESNIAVALSSLVSKYQRELFMYGFNRWWAERIPGLRPTEGYPQDARRFLEEVCCTAEKLGISREVFWRNR